MPLLYFLVLILAIAVYLTLGEIAKRWLMLRNHMALAVVAGDSKKRRLNVAAANALRAHVSVMALRFERAER